MTKRARPTAQTTDATNRTITTQVPTGRLAPAHFDELALIWPADPRIPSPESRRAWALARNLAPSNVHKWFQRRRPIAKKLRLKIPNDTYELPVGNPPVITIVIKDEPEQSEVPAPSAPSKSNGQKKVLVKIEADEPPAPKRSHKKKVMVDIEVDEPPAPPKRSHKKKVVVDIEGDEPPAPKKSLKKKAVKLKPEHAPLPLVTNQSKKKTVEKTPTLTDKTKATLKRKRNADSENPRPSKQSKPKKENVDVELPTDNVLAKADATKTLKRKRKTEIETETPSDKVAEPTTRPTKKKKTVAVESPAATDVAAKPVRKNKTVRFSSPITDTPPSSSPTLRASSPRSDASTVVDNPSPPSKSSQKSTYTPPSDAPDSFSAIKARVRRSAKSKDLAPTASAKKTTLQKTGASKKGKAKAKAKPALVPIPVPIIDVANSAPTPADSGPSPATVSVSAIALAEPKPEPEAEPEPEALLSCDQGNRDSTTSTGFTCVLCSLTGTDDLDVSSKLTDVPTESFHWRFGFPSALPAKAFDYTDICVDVTPLSAIPFLADPNGYATQWQEPRTEEGCLEVDEEGCFTMDGQRFTWDGWYVGEGPFAPVKPAVPPPGSGWGWLAGNGARMPDDEEGYVDVVGDDPPLDENSDELRLPPYYFEPDSEEEEED
ncbi:hypothetical protein C8R43DRAFT_1029596, partial [Mycena crocata]